MVGAQGDHGLPGWWASSPRPCSASASVAGFFALWDSALPLDCDRARAILALVGAGVRAAAGRAVQAARHPRDGRARPAVPDGARGRGPGAGAARPRLPGGCCGRGRRSGSPPRACAPDVRRLDGTAQVWVFGGIASSGCVLLLARQESSAGPCGRGCRRWCRPGRPTARCRAPAHRLAPGSSRTAAPARAARGHGRDRGCRAGAATARRGAAASRSAVSRSSSLPAPVSMHREPGGRVRHPHVQQAVAVSRRQEAARSRG